MKLYFLKKNLCAVFVLYDVSYCIFILYMFLFCFQFLKFLICMLYQCVVSGCCISVLYKLCIVLECDVCVVSACRINVLYSCYILQMINWFHSFEKYNTNITRSYDTLIQHIHHTLIQYKVCTTHWYNTLIQHTDTTCKSKI